MTRLRVAADTGGTFTDLVAYDEQQQRLTIAKVPSTPDDPSVAVAAGVRRLRGEDEPVTAFCHGTTVTTNALLTGSGAPTALAVTEGFTGIYEVGEQARPYGAALFDLDYRKPALLAPPERTIEVRERVAANGEVLTPLDTAHLRAQLRALAADPPAALAVCLLFSFLRPEHEQRVGEIVAEELPGCRISLSSLVLPKIREYQRLSTTVLNAYLAPLLDGYVRRLDGRLHQLGVVTPQRYVMQSNGGTSTFARIGGQAVTTLLSGPAGGVTAGVALGRALGVDDVITFDMGGTSCDVSLVRGGQPSVSDGGVIAGHRVGVPMIDINTVSAGGGTVARLDALAVLQVGPGSAGAVPGPACYGRGGTQPTVTDANVALGYLGGGAEMGTGGGPRLDRDLAVRAIEQRVAAPLGMDPLEAAEGIVRIVDTAMVQAIKAISTMRGHDPRDFTLLAFGGAGPVHAGSMLRELGMRAAVVPYQAGVFSALGLLLADVRHDHVRSRLAPLADVDPSQVNAMFGQMTQDAVKELHDEGFGDDDIGVGCALDLRYAGQGYELAVPCVPPLRDGGLRELRGAFDRLHAERYGHAATDSPVEIVSYRVTATGRTPSVEFERLRAAEAPVTPSPAAHRQARFDGRTLDCPVYRRDGLPVGTVLRGPLIVEQPDATVVVGADQQATVDALRNLVLEEAGGG